MSEHGARDMLWKAIFEVDTLILHANVCVMRPRNMVGAFLLPLPSLVDTHFSQEMSSERP
jgi:hypothetical protein